MSESRVARTAADVRRLAPSPGHYWQRPVRSGGDTRDIPWQIVRLEVDDGRFWYEFDEYGGASLDDDIIATFARELVGPIPEPEG